MLCCLLDGHARTSTELAAVAGVSPSTASVHLARLGEQRLVKTLAQGKHRYHRLDGDEVARALEALMVVAGGPRERFVPSTPPRLRAARTCYDHMAGAVSVSPRPFRRAALVLVLLAGRRRLRAHPGRIGRIRSPGNRRGGRPRAPPLRLSCVDWSERRPHLGGLSV
jgi:hypothetical protein